MKQHWKKIFLAAVITGLLIAANVYDLGKYLTFENFKLYKDTISQFIGKRYALSVVIYIALYVATAALAIPGAAILTIAGGFMFGLIGVLYVNVGATAGAALAFLVSRYLLGDYLQNKYTDKLKTFNEEIVKNGQNYLLTLRFIPAFPFFLINIFAGLTRIPLRTFVWTTSLGIIPGSFVYIYAGTQLGSLNNPGDILTWRVMLFFIFLGILSIVPVLINKIRKK